MSDTNTLPSPPVSDLHVKINELEARVIELQTQLANARYNHHSDIEKIGERLLELADEHSWCSTFDTEVDELNRVLTIELPTRKQEWEVILNVRLNVECTESELDDIVKDAVYEIERADYVYDVEETNRDVI